MKRSGEGWNTFSEATQIVLSKWDLTRTAVAERWGGLKSKDKYNHMVDDLMLNLSEQWKDGNDVHEDTLDVYFLECLEAYFNVDFEGGDDSIVTEVSLIIQDLYRKCAAGHLAKARDVIASLDAMPSMRKGGVRATGGGVGEGGGEEDEEDDEDEDEFDEEVEGGDMLEEGGKGGGGGGSGGGSSNRRGTAVDEDGWETVLPKKGGNKKQGGGGVGDNDMD